MGIRVSVHFDCLTPKNKRSSGSSMSRINLNNLNGPESPHFSGEQPESVLPWEEVDDGRFMPRRIRGSYQGRALG